MCGISRQAHFQMLQRIKTTEQKSVLYIRMMEEIRQIHPGMGLRTMYDMLMPEGIGRDAFIALGLQEGFRLKNITKKIRTTYSVKSSRYSNLLGPEEFTDINQIWSSDITYFPLGETFHYIVFVMDVYSRRIVGHSLADNMRAENNVKALKKALKLRGVNDYEQRLIHHSDKGTQYASDDYTELLEQYGIRISMCNEVYENTHIERVNDTIKNQYLNRMHIADRGDLKRKLDKAVEAYNEQRPHQSLHRMSPVQYENHILSIPKEKREKLKIYTRNLNENKPTTIQLELFQNL